MIQGHFGQRNFLTKTVVALSRLLAFLLVLLGSQTAWGQPEVAGAVRVAYGSYTFNNGLEGINKQSGSGTYAATDSRLRLADELDNLEYTAEWVLHAIDGGAVSQRVDEDAGNGVEKLRLRLDWLLGKRSRTYLGKLPRLPDTGFADVSPGLAINEVGPPFVGGADGEDQAGLGVEFNGEFLRVGLLLTNECELEAVGFNVVNSCGETLDNYSQSSTIPYVILKSKFWRLGFRQASQSAERQAQPTEPDNTVVKINNDHSVIEFAYDAFVTLFSFEYHQVSGQEKTLKSGNEELDPQNKRNGYTFGLVIRRRDNNIGFQLGQADIAKRDNPAEPALQQLGYTVFVNINRYLTFVFDGSDKEKQLGVAEKRSSSRLILSYDF